MDTEIIRLMSPHITGVILVSSSCYLAALSPVLCARNVASRLKFEEITFEILAVPVEACTWCWDVRVHVSE